jgi:spore maturation protein CgeB
MRILYTGPFRVGSMTESRRQALIDLGHDVVGLDQVPYLDRGPARARKLMVHALIGPGISAYNRDFARLAVKTRADLIYVDTGSYLWPRTIAAARATGSRIAHYSSEYFGHHRHFYRHFFPAVPLYDVHVITQPPSRPILEAHGALDIVRTEFGYDPRLHRPVQLLPHEQAEYASDLVFVGHWEPTTERMIVALRRSGLAVMVWGPGWNRAKEMEDAAAIRPIYGEEYIKVLSAAKICLCFLSKWGLNYFSVGRTFEIPAIGQFLLAERTTDHQNYYHEGREAEFFGSIRELVQKAHFFLAHPAERDRIARAGHARCLSSGYSHQERCRTLLDAMCPRPVAAPMEPSSVVVG